MKGNLLRLTGIGLLVLGVLALVYGGFTYTSDTHEADLGPIELSVEEQETVDVPVWAGVAGVSVGALLLLVGGKR